MSIFFLFVMFSISQTELRLPAMVYGWFIGCWYTYTGAGRKYSVFSEVTINERFEDANGQCAIGWSCYWYGFTLLLVSDCF